MERRANRTFYYEIKPNHSKSSSIIHNYAAFDISTIDKFTHKVIRAFAHDLNLPMTLKLL
jgi:hypothetical protein